MTTRDAHRRANPCYSGTLEQTEAHEAPQQAAAHVGLHRGDGRGLDPGRGTEVDTAPRRGFEHPVEHHTVKVQVRIAPAGAGRRDRRDAPPSPPCVGCCTRDTHRAPCRRRRSGSRARFARNGRGRNHGRECRTRGSGGSRARRSREPRRCRRTRHVAAQATSRNASGPCAKAACVRAAAGDTASRCSPWPTAVSRGPLAPDEK